MLENLKNKKILILGFGREGQDTFLFLRKLFPDKILGVGDRLESSELKAQSLKLINKDKKVKLHLGKDYLKALKNYDVIIKSPGIPFKIFPKSALKKIVAQTEIFFENCPGKIIGITGTKGKSTTTSLIYKILKEGGLKAHLVGNIGKPVLNLLFSATPNDVYVYELSSHQLYSLKKSPHVAVFLNVYPEHLDYYRNFKEYAAAKANIVRYQTRNDYLIFNSRDKIVKEIAKKSKAKKIPIKGKYYSLDKAAARAAGRVFGIPSKTIQKAIAKFKYLPHRLELVGTFKGITFYNDALATIPEATIAALEVLGNRVETIILGGFDRNIDFKNLAEKVLKSKIKTVILFPTTGEKIWQAILKISRGSGVPKQFFADEAKRTKFSSSATRIAMKGREERMFFDSPRNSGARYMKEAVKTAYQHTKKGKICLLSTASPSFSIFKDYREKGNLFKKYVKKFG